MAGIALAQLTRAGAPVSYGGFSSNVDMKSGSPAFGTPEHLKMQIGGGQLARHIGLPWRSPVGTASKLADAQGATETVNSLWGAMMANATTIVHAAGWVEGGLSFGYEKFINDIESLQIAAEMCSKLSVSTDEIGFDALAAVAPAGHFFDTPHTMQRYQTAFYPTLIADTANYGTWHEAGAQSAEQRAIQIWRRTLDAYVQPETGLLVPDRLAAYIEKNTESGGAAPLE
jgi:trimethylamine--corrinoid protein Co-methyltransferase